MRPEILAPAGSMDALRAAVHAGADAVYLGGNRFGARAYADNFDSATLIDAIEYCHLYGVKVYLTINTLFRNEEITELKSYLQPLYEAGLDAVIVQDFGVMKYVHSIFPKLPIHASTQMTITTAYAYELLKNYGVTRIVPARELSLKEIATLKQADCVPEVEVFVQGALCYCYSGQCLMSSFLGGRSGNRGRCAQTCRLPYTLYDDNERLIETEGEYLLSPKDLCGLEAIPKLVEASVDSFKIEGRMKRPEYVAVCVRAYRELLDAWYEGRFTKDLVQKYKNEMAEVFNRGGFTKGYYNQKNGRDMMSVKNPGNIGVSIGKITSINKNQIAVLLDQDVYKGDVFMPSGKEEAFTLTNNVIGKKGERIILNIPKGKRIYKGQEIRRMSKHGLMQELESYITDAPKNVLHGTLKLVTGELAAFHLETVLKGQRFSCTYHGDLVEPASNLPLTEETVKDKVLKTGTTRYHFDSLEVQMSEDAFYSLKALKELRRNVFVKLDETILEQSRRSYQNDNEDCTLQNANLDNRYVSQKNEHNRSKCNNVVMVSNIEQYEVVKQYDCFECIYIDMQYFDLKIVREILEKNSRLAIALPPVLRAHFLTEVKEIVSLLSKRQEDVAVVIRNIDELGLLYKLNYSGKVIADYSLYAMNDWSAAFIKDCVPNVRLTIPVELNEHQIQKLSYLSDACEMEVYGYQQLMVSAQCLQNTTKKCNGKNAHFIMKDRYLKNFSIFSVCKYCYNLIYNGIPTVLYDVLNLSMKDMVTKRLHFTMENQQEVKQVVEAYMNGSIPGVEKTRGHYKRGVE